MADKQDKLLEAEEEQRIQQGVLDAQNEYEEAILQGNFSPELAMQIGTDPRLSTEPEKSRSLINWQSQYASAVTEKKVASQAEILQSREDYDKSLENTSVSGKEASNKILMDDAWMFTTTENKARQDKLKNPPETSNTLKAYIDQVDRTLAMEEKAIGDFGDATDEDEITDEIRQQVINQRAKVLRGALEIQQEMRDWKAENPKAAPAQEISAYEKYLESC